MGNSGTGERSALELLPWDSEHFGFPVARLANADLDDNSLREHLESSRRARYRLIYWNTHSGRAVPESLLQAFGGRLADRRAVYETTELVNPASRGSSDLRSRFQIEPHEGEVSSRLVELGIAAGADSRFRLDPNVPEGAFERLYEIWMRRSCSGELADAVLVAKDDASEPIGIVTIRLKERYGQIGLIAVAEESRGTGAGAQLMYATHRWLNERGAKRCRVVTQLDNEAACRLYERAGYRLAENTLIYHFWPCGTPASLVTNSPSH